MKLNEILSDSFNAAEWEAKGYELPKYDIAAVAKKTHDEPTWVHFGQVTSSVRSRQPSSTMHLTPASTIVVLLLQKASTTKSSTRLIALTITSRFSSASRATEPSRRRSSLLSQKASRRISSFVRTGPDWSRFFRHQVCRW